ncbi:MAG: hypothetical protein HND51_08350 [Chloroflexi bacterium]|nr:hypothetical protein [Chloroflexota bacterium]
MKKIELSKNLKRRKAIVSIGENGTPDDYFDIAGMFIDGEMYAIAVPKSLLDKATIMNALAKEAEACLSKAIE